MNKKDKKPVAKVLGQDGNVYNLIGICQKALKNAGRHDDAKKMFDRIKSEAQSYQQALVIMQEYVVFG